MELEQADRNRIALREEKDKIIRYQQDQIEHLRRKLEVFDGDSQKKSLKENGIRDDSSVIIQSDVEMFTPSKIKKMESAFELKMMELESNCFYKSLFL